MKARLVLGALLVTVVAVACVSLGLWQLRRLAEKRALNAALRAALTAPPRELAAPLPPLAAVRDRRVRVRGRYDESRQVLLGGHFHAGEAGVDVVTPLLLGDSAGAVLVDRGWLAAEDPTRARPQDHPEPGERTVIGLVQAPVHGPRGAAPVALATDRGRLWLTLHLDVDSLAARFPYPLAPYVVQALPGPGVPAMPAKELPPPYPEALHVSYAIQWFAFAALALIAPVVLLRRRRADGAASTKPPTAPRG